MQHIPDKRKEANQFTVFPAIDLRRGRVVRLKQGDVERETLYSVAPARVAAQWIAQGARWLHVVNLDGALEQDGNDNHQRIVEILAVTRQTPPPVSVQLGGGLRSLAAIEKALSLGVQRVILGTAAVETPGLVQDAIREFTPERIGISLDVRDQRVLIAGWQRHTGMPPLELVRRYAPFNLRHVVFTNIARDGMNAGLDLEGAKNLAHRSGLSVVASGGVASLQDIRMARKAGLAGVIIGRALYDGQINLPEALQC